MGAKSLYVSVVLIGTLVVNDARFISRKLRNGEPCNMPGFFGDAEDCRKFYRCAEHPTDDPNNPHLIRYSFRCPNGTVFDDALSTCNHPEAVMDKPANCQVYDPDDGQSGDGDGSDGSSGSGYGYVSSPLGNALGLSGGIQIQQQPQYQQHQQLTIPNSQIVYLPMLTIPYGNMIQYG